MIFNIRKLLVTHFVLPLIALAIISIAITTGDVDRIVADYFYSIQGGSWAWKNSWIAENFFHKGGRSVSIFLAFILLILLTISLFNSLLANYKKPLLYVFLATAGGSLIVSALKTSLLLSCPWEFSRYGGDIPYISVARQLFLRNGDGCFPAGHASAGYAWISCYFFGLYYQSSWRWLGLAIPIIAGTTLGVVQQVRGAHFLSHDIWSLAICWFFSLVLFLLFFQNPMKSSITPELICP